MQKRAPAKQPQDKWKTVESIVRILAIVAKTWHDLMK
jgi:hypothetical protein